MAFDQKLFKLEIQKQAGSTLVRDVRPLIKADFEAQKAKFLAEYDNDEVTQELAAGPHATSTVLSKGNLYSLLGFDSETADPAGELRDYLEHNVVLYKTNAGKLKNGKLVFETPAYFPNEEDVNTVMAQDPKTKLEWTTRSFTDLISRGVDGFSRYLFAPERDFSNVPSRSGPAIQVKKDLRGGEAPPIPYVKRLLGVLKDLLSKNR